MNENLQKIEKSALMEIETTETQKELEKIKVKYLGRKGMLNQILRSLKDLSLEERRQIGPQAQKIKKILEEKINLKFKTLTIASTEQQKFLDVTRPGKKISFGHLHPLSKIEEEIRQIFIALNFSVVEGPEIETEYYNFDALNIPPNHPARDAWNTFWLRSNQKEQLTIDKKQLTQSQMSNVKGQKLLLRTHTSPMQIHYMETHQPPFQIIVPGRVFRYEATDASHETNFSQVEGLMVGENVSLANFKFIVEKFLQKLFGEKIDFALRPSYYPFVEPGVDVYMKWQGGWLEVAGAGMVHPHVFKAVGYNPYQWQGFAFGFGLNRLAMIKYKIPDIRLFYSGDLRFIGQF